MSFITKKVCRHKILIEVIGLALLFAAIALYSITYYLDNSARNFQEHGVSVQATIIEKKDIISGTRREYRTVAVAQPQQSVPGSSSALLSSDQLMSVQEVYELPLLKTVAIIFIPGNETFITASSLKRHLSNPNTKWGLPGAAAVFSVGLAVLAIAYFYRNKWRKELPERLEWWLCCIFGLLITPALIFFLFLIISFMPQSLSAAMIKMLFDNPFTCSIVFYVASVVIFRYLRWDPRNADDWDCLP